MSDDNRTQELAMLKNLPEKYGDIELSPAVGIRQSADDLYLRAQIILQSGMAPKSFKNVKELVYALGMGQDLGFTNLQSLANITVINNKPSVYADGLPAILLRSGHFFMEEFTGTIEDETYKATITIERKDSGSIITREFDVGDAKRAGLWQPEPIITKNGRHGPYETKNDSPWHKYPKRMIWRRAIGWAVRDGLADEMYGVQIVEEQRDHEQTIRESAEPKTSRLGDKVRSMANDEDIIEIDEIVYDVDEEPEVLDIDQDVDQREFEDKLHELDISDEEKAAFTSNEKPEEDPVAASDGDPDAAEDATPSVAEGSEPIFDSNGRALPNQAIDWFDYLRGPMYDSSNFEEDFDQETAQAWFKDLSEEDKSYVNSETLKICAEREDPNNG